MCSRRERKQEIRGKGNERGGKGKRSRAYLPMDILIRYWI
jgi:hypothetical protein